MLPPLALPDLVVTGVGVACITIAAAVLIIGLRRREAGYDPMLIVSAGAVVGLALVILITR